MTKDEIIEFINANKTAYFATVDDGKPRVRAMGMYKADETGIYFQSWTMKDVHKQLVKNPEVELCYNGKGAQVRISGQMEIIDDLEKKKEVVEQRPFMKPTVEEHGYDVVALYRLKNAKAHVWTMDTNFDPKNYIDL